MAPGDVSMFKGDKNDNGTFDFEERDSYPGDFDDHADQFSIAFHEFVHWQEILDYELGDPDAYTHKLAANPTYEECWSDTGHGRTAEAVRDDHDVDEVEDIYEPTGHVH